MREKNDVHTMGTDKQVSEIDVSMCVMVEKLSPCVYLRSEKKRRQ